MRGRTLGLAGIVALHAATAMAQAPAVECDDAAMDCPVGPTTVYLTGSPALEPVVRLLGPAISKAYGTDFVYLHGVEQCTAAQQVIDGIDLGGITGAFFGDPKHFAGRCCRVPYFSSTKVDMWVSDSPVEDCFDGQVPHEYQDFPGPIAAYTMAVPTSSEQWAITVEEAYFVFGFGSGGYKGQPVSPWTDQTQFLIPGPAYGAQSVWGKFLRLPAVARPGQKPQLNPGAPVLGNATGGIEHILSVLGDPMVSGKGAIALTTSQALEGGAARSRVRPLAIQGWNQKRAFYPDSTSHSFDKRNVREGRYPFWAATHMVAKVDVTGRVLRDRADNLISIIQGAELPGASAIDATIAAGLVPGCAMKVQRPKDKPIAGDLAPYTPAPGAACGCYMDELLSRGSSGCSKCDASTPCAGGRKCSNGFCE